MAIENEEKSESRRELLEKAWEKLEEPVNEGKTPESESSGTPEESDVSASEAIDSGTGKSQEGTSKTVPEKGQKGEEKKVADPDRQERKAANEKPEGERQPQVTDKAPNAWKAGVREHWAKLPAEVRAEVTRREQEIQRELSQTSQIRKFAQDFATVVNPFNHLIRAQNSTPLQAVHNLMTTAAGLAQGNTYQKAAIVAQIIENNGVDIKTLDDILSKGGSAGRMPPGFQQQPNQQQNVPPPWAKPFFDFMGQVQSSQQAMQERLQAECDQEIEAFQETPFFEDVREDMADLMEAAANRGRAMTIQQAYEIAVSMNPEISKVVQQRKAAEQSNNNSSTVRARKASSTISGGPTGGVAVGSKEAPKSRREALMQAWDDARDR